MNGRQERLRDIGLEKQVFVDDYIVDSVAGVSRVLHPGQKDGDNPLLRAEREWEAEAELEVLTAFYDQETRLFRLWYAAGERVCYATSTDGLSWERPSLGLVDFRGSKENNVVQGLAGPTNGIVYSPEMVGTEFPEKYYKSLRREEEGWAVYYSGDGLVWTRREENPVLKGALLGEICTTGKSSERFPKGVFYKQSPPPKYLAFPQLQARVGRFERRCVGFSGCPMTFPDTFTAWSDASLILAPDLLDDELAGERLASAGDMLRLNSQTEYRSEFSGLAGFRYFGAFAGFLWVLYVGGDGRAPSPGSQDGIAEVQLASSRDLIHWQRTEQREAVIPRGPEGAWDAGQIYTTNFPFVAGNQIWTYYTGKSWGLAGVGPADPRQASTVGTAGIGLARWRADGLVSLEAGDTEGSMTTQPLLHEGAVLAINARCQQGTLDVEVLDREGRPLAGFSRAECDAFSGDSLRHIVRWRGRSDLSALRGEPLRLRFHLRRANLYSLVFAEGSVA